MEKGHKAWLIIEQEYVGENEPDGAGNWIPKVITRVVAGTEDALCLNAVLAAMKAFVQAHESAGRKHEAALTIINSEQVGKILPPNVVEVIIGSEKSLLDQILEGE